MGETIAAGGFEDTEFNELENRGFINKFKSLAKLSFIAGCYAAALISLAQFGFWLVEIPKFHQIIVPTDFITWLQEKSRYGVWWDMVTVASLRNMGLLLAFWAQHTLMSQRFIGGTSYWMQTHYVYKMDRPLYILATAIVLQGILRLWQPVPVTIWSIDVINDYFVYVHIFAWISLYGMSLMLDLPEMAGFNQVVITSPTLVKKSPDLQIMYKTQRHMGFLPFIIMLLVHPQMTLDRFLLTACTICYTYVCWQSPGCYAYACRMKQLKKGRQE